MSTPPKVVLAYSGGLDTSCAIKWLRDQDYEVIAFLADIGQEENTAQIKARAIQIGARKAYALDLKEEFVTDYIFPALKAGAIYEGKYLLATALSRPLIAKYQVQIAQQEKARAIAHGCTGKGNDQVRFEVTARLLDPRLETMAPVRMWEFKTRQEEIEYAKRHKIPMKVTTKNPYSIDKNVYGRSIECGILEDPWAEPPEEIYQMTVSPQQAPNRPTYVTIDFKGGLPIKIDGTAYSPIHLISKLNELGGKNGIGRVDVIENRLVGIKSREIYENPAGTILHLSHEELESFTLDRETLHYKQLISQKYAELIYYGLWETPLRSQLDAYVTQTQKRVTGTIRLKLYKGNCTIVGRKSKFSLYREELATYGAKDKFDQKLAEGFIKIWAMPYEKY